MPPRGRRGPHRVRWTSPALLALLPLLAACESETQYSRNQRAIDGELAVADATARCVAARREHPERKLDCNQ